MNDVGPPDADLPEQLGGVEADLVAGWRIDLPEAIASSS